MSAGSQGSQKRAFDPLGLEFQEVVSHLTLILGTKSSPPQGKEVSLTNEPALQPQVIVFFLLGIH